MFFARIGHSSSGGSGNNSSGSGAPSSGAMQQLLAARQKNRQSGGANRPFPTKGYHRGIGRQYNWPNRAHLIAIGYTNS